MKVKLLVVHGRPKGKSLRFPHGEFVIGRGQECHVRPNSEWVSRQHCLLRVTDQYVWLRDLGSTNGTLVNGRRILADQPLQEGDHVQVGPLVLEVHLEDAAAQSAAQPLPGQASEARDVCSKTAEMRALDTLPTATIDG